ncbi:MAG: right-handed parallel beta-helix repeat-containing protein [Eubacteriales bacterium]|nr:right-handed parallel beta-helix repeat-containing protein [Eubacteriales bacterium]
MDMKKGTRSCKYNIPAMAIALLLFAVFPHTGGMSALSLSVRASVPWQHEYRLRGDDSFQVHARQVIETGVTAPSGKGEVYYAGPYDDVQGIINRLSPGDTLYLRGGVYNRKIRLYGGVQGREDAYITIAAMPGEDVVFDGSGLSGHDQDQDGPSMFWLYGCGYVQLTGFEVRNAHGRDASAILLEPGTHHVVVSDLYIHNISTPSPRSEDHCANAILVMGRSGSTISNVLLFRNTIENCETGWSEAISVAANVSSVNIVGNRLNDTGNIAICFAGNYGNAPSSVDYPRGGLVYGNTVTNCHCVYDTGFAIYADGAQDVDFVGNTVKSCDGGIEAGAENGGHATRNILIANNLLTDCAEAAVGIGTPGGGGHVESVSVYGNRYRHVGWLSGGASILRFGSSNVSTYDNSYIEDDSQMNLPYFPTFTNPGLH